MVVFMAMIYYSRKIQSKISKDKWCTGPCSGEARCKFLRALSQWTIMGFDNACKMLPTRKAH